KAALIGVIISASFIFGFFFLPRLTTFFFTIPRNWGAYFLIFLNYLLIAIIEELYLRGLIQTKLFKESSRIKNWTNILAIALIGGFIQGISVFFMLLPLNNFTFTYGSFTLQLHLLGFLGGVIIFTILGIFHSWIFQKTQHILPAAIVQASIMSWFLVIFMVPL
ncbi:MAG: type II CAAX prenyl endopeptidase Rce1 family protein, partial [Promethearchaeota archaeon]